MRFAEARWGPIATSSSLMGTGLGIISTKRPSWKPMPASPAFLAIGQHRARSTPQPRQQRGRNARFNARVVGIDAFDEWL